MSKSEETPRKHAAVRWTELIATVGVMLSLIFVGVQIRQNTAAIRVGTYQDLAAHGLDINLTLAANPELAAAYTAYRGTSMSPVEASISTIVVSLVRHPENAYRMRQMGAYDDQFLRRAEANPLFASPNFSEWWGRNSGRFDADFRAYMDSVIVKARAGSQ